MTATQEKIKKVSLFFRWLFLVLLIAIPIVHTISWRYAPVTIDVSQGSGLFVSAVPKGIQVLHPLSSSTKIYGFLIGTIPVIVIEFILYFLIRLFKLYERAEIFSIQNVKYIKKIGYGLLISQIATIISNTFLSALLTWDNPTGLRTITVTVSGTHISLMLTAGIIILISWIMAEGCHLREEQQLTI